MKITSVTAMVLRYQYENGIADAQNYFSTRNAVLVQVTTDEGITGIGESACFGGPAESTKYIIENELQALLVGEDATNIEYLWKKVSDRTRQHGRGGIIMAAMSGIDVALWDILGKKTGMPVYKLLGGYTDKLQPYASSGFYSRGKGTREIAEEVGNYYEQGFKYAKIKAQAAIVLVTIYFSMTWIGNSEKHDVIARSVARMSFRIHDVPEFHFYAIADGSGDPLYVAASYWPSAFCRYVWEYKVALAIDAVETMGFNEIQFDYVRFPDRTDKYEEAGTIDFRNEYGETKAQAIQRFLMYATDILHEYGVYVGADVFGEASSNYVTAYGQYWPAVSNVVDVISGMPYPDHFARNGTYRPWEHPYETLLDWTESAAKRQSETPSPAIDRTWIQAYNAIQPPYNEYGVQEIGDEIRGLREQGFTGGFMAWNASCSLTKLEELRPLYEALE